MPNYTLSYSGEQVNDAIGRIHDLLNLIYPVGSIYMSVNNVSPADFIGGYWEPIEGRFLLAASDTHTAGSTGGEETHQILTTELPSHSHTITGIEIGAANSGRIWLTGQADGNIVAYNGNGTSRWAASTNKSDGLTVRTFRIGTNGTVTSNARGDGTAHNNMPPYLSVYVWKRVL